MKLVKLTTPDGRPFFVNPHSVVAVYSNDDSQAKLCVQELNSPINIVEKPEEIVRLINEAPAVPVFGGIISYPPSTYIPPVWIPGPADNPPWGTVSATTPPTPGLEVPVSFLQPKQQP